MATTEMTSVPAIVNPGIEAMMTVNVTIVIAVVAVLPCLQSLIPEMITEMPANRKNVRAMGMCAA